MAAQDSSNSQCQPLSSRILGHVRRLVNDMEALKMDPHRMGGIG